MYTDSRYVTQTTSFPSRYASKNFLDQNSVSEPLTIYKYYIYISQRSLVIEKSHAFIITREWHL